MEEWKLNNTRNNYLTSVLSNLRCLLFSQIWERPKSLPNLTPKVAKLKSSSLFTNKLDLTSWLSICVGFVCLAYSLWFSSFLFVRVWTSSRKFIGETIRPTVTRDEENSWCVYPAKTIKYQLFSHDVWIQAQTKSKQHRIGPVYYTLCAQLFRQRHKVDQLFSVTSSAFLSSATNSISTIVVFFVLKEVQSHETKQKHKANSLLPTLF